jgi:hypothetical protein
MKSKSTMAAVALTALLTIYARHASADSAPAGASIVGLWRGTLSFSGQTLAQAFETFHSDGTEALNTNHAPSQGNVSFGVWVEGGPHTYRVTHPSWRWDASGNLIGTEVVRQTITIDVHGSRFTGTATIDILDLAGNLLTRFTGLEVKGERIAVDF